MVDKDWKLDQNLRKKLGEEQMNDWSGQGEKDDWLKLYFLKKVLAFTFFFLRVWNFR